MSDLQGRIIAQQNFVNDTNGVSDCNGHGTKVASIAAGTVYGVAKHASIVNWRLADCGGYLYDSSTIAAIDAMTSRHINAGIEAAIATCSWIFFAISPGVEDSIRGAVRSGINVITAAGNASTDACLFSPSRLGNPTYFNDPNGLSVITVGATTSADAKQGTSDFGPCVDIFAPGVNTAAMNKFGTPENFSDTSAAVPHVAGVAAMFLEQSPQIINNTNSLEGLIKDNGVPMILTNIGTGSPNLLLQNWVHRRRP